MCGIGRRVSPIAIAVSTCSASPSSGLQARRSGQSELGEMPSLSLPSHPTRHGRCARRNSRSAKSRGCPTACEGRFGIFPRNARRMCDIAPHHIEPWSRSRGAPHEGPLRCCCCCWCCCWCCCRCCCRNVTYGMPLQSRIDVAFGRGYQTG